MNSTEGSIQLPDLTVPKSTRTLNASESNPIDSYTAITVYPYKEVLDNDPDDTETDGGDQTEGGDEDDASNSSPLEKALMKTIADNLVINPKKMNEQGEELYCYCNRVSFGDVSSRSPQWISASHCLSAVDDCL